MRDLRYAARGMCMRFRGLAAVFAAAVRLVPRLLRGEPFPRLNRDAYALLYALAGGGWFVNKGLAPLDPDMPRLPALAAEPFGAALYFEVLRSGAAALDRAPAQVVEVGCGPGGGLLLAAAMWPRARLAGFDLQPGAVREGAAGIAQAAPGRVLLAAADGFRLPVADGAADLLLSVEGLLNLDREAFLIEAARVLTPGGVLVATASATRPIAELRNLMQEFAPYAGLEALDVRDLTPRIVSASRQDAARRLGRLRHLPRPLRRPIENFVAAPGSALFESYASGERTYYVAVLRRMAGGGLAVRDASQAGQAT